MGSVPTHGCHCSGDFAAWLPCALHPLSRGAPPLLRGAAGTFFDVVVNLLAFVLVLGLASLTLPLRSTTCMTSPLGYIIALVFGVLPIFGDGISYVAASFAEAESQSEACLVPPPYWLGPFVTCPAEAHQNHSSFASFQGRGFPEKTASSNGLERTAGVALRVMQENEVTECLVLRPVRAILGSLLSPYQCTAGAVATFTGTTVAKPAYFLPRKEPSSKDQAEISEEERQSVLATCRGASFDQERVQQSFLALRPFMEHASTCGTTDDGWQGLWQRLQPFEHAVGLSSPSASADACGTAGTTWSSVDAAEPATSYASDANDAFYAAHGSRYDTSTTGSCARRSPGRAEEREKRPIQAQQDRQSSQKRGSLVARVSRLSSQRDEERRQREHRRLACSSEGTWSGKGVLDGSRKGAHATLVAVAYLFATICGEVERIHCAIPIIRDVLPYPNARSHSLSQASPTQSGSSQEEGGQVGHGQGRSSADFRRRHGRVRHQRGGGAATRRACSKDPRRTTPGGHQPVGPFRVSRKAGTQGQTTTHQRRRGAAWSQIFQLAAFCQGRCFVTDVYEHQRPFDECSQWTHTILSEPTFLSPWRAAEQAFDLAIECGNWQTLRVDTFSLTPKKRCTKPGVRFDESVLVFQGKTMVRSSNHTLLSSTTFTHGPFLDSALLDLSCLPAHQVCQVPVRTLCIRRDSHHTLIRPATSLHMSIIYR